MLEPLEKPNRALEGLWRRFLRKEQPDRGVMQGYLHTPVSRTSPAALRAFKRHLIRRFEGSLERMNRELQTDFLSWDAVQRMPDPRLLRGARTSESLFDDAWLDFRASLPIKERVWLFPSGVFRALYLPALYGDDVAGYNRIHGTNYASHDEVPFPSRVPVADTRAREDWEYFVRHILHPQWIRISPAAQPGYARYLDARYGSIDTLNKARGTAYGSFNEAFPGRPGCPDSDFYLAGWQHPDDGTLYRLPARYLELDGVDFRFQKYLQHTFSDIESLNRLCGTAYGCFASVLPPQRDMHYLDMLARRRALRRELAWRNYAAVLDHLLVHGRGVWNTLVYCGLSVLLALLLTPPAAFALSRWRSPLAPKILFLFLVTLSVPPMVTQIPLFLLLRDLRLLNTFAALVLPGMVNGYAIFLLKCYFDALPVSLFESAWLDGAGVWRQFRYVALPQARPILAVLALQVFVMAYGNFLGALLVCQDRRMWTLSLWLYQLQQRSGPGVLHASLLLSSVPLMAVFLLCHRVMTRGFVLPAEH